MAQLEPTKGGYYLWKYLPSVPAAVIFLLLFLGMTALISWRMYKTKTWFCLPFAIGGFFEFAGYCARTSAHNKTGRIMPYAVQNFFILLGPALFAASIYMCLSRIIRGIRAGHHSLIKPRNLTRTFVSGDILSFVVQGGAAGIMVTGKNPKLGEGIVIAGLMIQIIMFGLFAATAVIFQRRIKSNPTNESCDVSIPWQKSMRMLFIVSALIMIRSCFRVVEFATGNDGYLLGHEWTLYIFDSVLMFAVTVVYYLWYPTWITPEKLEGDVFLAERDSPAP
ncbi:hypothetical protein N8I77_011885 [Diaporthe amygdali]|uniref:RTA1 like protein n=1 Tax=Phomopsis amygdali TaxID=1214568 RepID=A0AAD9S6J9_PHOAM|nr:hypothetical protein N8I77_011885 [Diaporthe amygdali]